MALFDVLLPPFINNPQLIGLHDRIMDSDWNHWKLQFQSLMSDAKERQNDSSGKPENCQSSNCENKGTNCQSRGTNCENVGTNCNEWFQQLVNAFGVNPQNNETNKFVIKLDVSHFSANEITVKTKDNYVIVIGKHEEKEDEDGWVRREFTRRYQVPNDVEIEKLTSHLTPNGVLVIEAPRKIQEDQNNSRVIPVIREQNATKNDSNMEYNDNQHLD